jgi:hypothetical protein
MITAVWVKLCVSQFICIWKFITMSESVHRKMPYKDNSDDEWQRQRVRWAVKQGASVVFKKSFLLAMFKPRPVQTAEIIDISNSGIRAQYTATTVWSNDFDKMSIVTTDRKITIDDIPCKIISDSVVSRLPNGNFVRRCGIKFGNLSDYHKLQLSHFIKKYSINSKDSKVWHTEFA